MTLAGVLLGLINIAIVVAVLLFIGAIIAWFCNYMTITVPTEVRKGYIVIVALIALYMVVALMFGMPTVHVITSAS